jgi:hypothetical protein
MGGVRWTAALGAFTIIVEGRPHPLLKRKPSERHLNVSDLLMNNGVGLRGAPLQFEVRRNDPNFVVRERGSSRL